MLFEKTTPGRIVGFSCLPAALAQTHGLYDIRGDDGVEPKRLMDIMAFAVMAVLLIASVISRGYSIKKQIVLFMPYGMLLVGLILPSYSSFLFEYYSRGILPSEGINLDSYEHEIAALRSEPRRIWLVSNQESFIDPEGKIRNALGQVVEPTKSICYYRVRIDLFEPKR